MRWNTLSESVTVDGTEFVGKLVPANAELGKLLGRSTWFDRYGNTGRTSVTLRSKEPDPRVANLWLTEISAGGEPLFRGVRSATITPYGVTDTEQWLTLASSGAREWLQLARELGMSKVSVIELQTPVRGDKKFDLESRVVAASRQALFEQAELLGIELHWFNLPTHHETYQRQLSSDFAVETQQELSALVIRAREAGGKVSLLADELERLLSNGIQPAEIYLLPAIVANIAHLLGELVFFNCRSGKDRSGMVDAETRFLAFQLHRLEQGGQLGDRHLREEELPAWSMLVFGEENLTVQELNTGVRGSKLQPLTKDFETDPLVNRVGRDRWLEFKGNSHLAEE